MTEDPRRALRSTPLPPLDVLVYDDPEVHGETLEACIEVEEASADGAEEFLEQGSLPAKVAPWDQSSWWRMVEAYREAAEHLLAAFFRTENGGEDLLYPALYLCRHACECAMKGIIARALKLEVSIPEHVVEDLHTTHNLGKLAEGVEAALEGLPPEGDLDERWTPIQRQLRFWQSVDGKGELARYPVEQADPPTEGTRGIGPGYTGVNLLRPIRVAWAVLAFWMQCEAWLDHLLEMQAEQQREMAGYR